MCPLGILKEGTSQSMHFCDFHDPSLPEVLGPSLSSLNWKSNIYSHQLSLLQTALKEEETGGFLIDYSFIKLLYLASC